MPKVKITWVKSDIGYRYDQKRTIKALGLKKLGQCVEHEASPAVLGMLQKVRHLIKVKNLESGV